MTRQTFYRNLRKTTSIFNWTVRSEGLIRGYKKSNDDNKLYVCPLAAVYFAKTGKYIDSIDFPIAADYLKISNEDRSTIVASADNFGVDSKESCRKAMLNSLRLIKRPPSN